MNSATYSSERHRPPFDEALIVHVLRSSERRKGATRLVLSKLEAHVARDSPSYHGLGVDIATARKVIESILRQPQKVVIGRKTMDVYGPHGRGIRLRRETSEFLTFLDIVWSSR